MKKILFSLSLMLFFTLSSAYKNPISNLSDSDSDNILQHSLPDSLYTLLKNKSIIFYSYGHYGYSWSLIANVDSNYQVYSGRVTYKGERYLHNKTESIPFDTTRLLSNNRSILLWGFDTIGSKANNMKKVRPESYVTSYTDLSVYNSEGINVFSSDDAIAYSGCDSIIFNKKYHRLCLLMRWLSDSKIREFIPDSAIY